MNGTKSFFLCTAIVLLVAMVCSPAHAQLGAAAAKSAAPAAKAATDKPPVAETPNQAKAEAASTDFCQCVSQDESLAVGHIDQVLRAPLRSSGLDYADTPLQDVMNSIQEEYGIPIQLDKRALEEAAIGTDIPVTITLHNITLRSALRLMLKANQLCYVIQNEVLMITTEEAANKIVKTCVYDVRAIVGERDDKELQSLIDTIKTCVETDSWSDGDGSGSIESVKPGMLVVTQTQAVHETIHSLLATLQKMRKARPAESNAGMRPTAKNELVVTRSYLLQLNPTKDIATMQTQVRDLITQSLPNESWSGQLDDGQAVTLTVFHDRVVVRQTPSVQAKLQKILSDSGVANPAQIAGDDLYGPGGAPGAVPPVGPEGAEIGAAPPEPTVAQ